MEVEHEQELVLEDYSNEDDKTIRAGTLWTTIAHIITAVIGSGVLSLAWSTAQLGWIGGPVVMLGFAFVTYISSCLLSDCYRSPDPISGARNRCFTDAVKVILGEKQAWICGLLQYLSFYVSGVAYVITTSTCMRAVMKVNCYHKEGHDASCQYNGNIYMLLFGVVQIFMSQIPDFSSMVLVSVVAAIMSFSYSSIGFGLGFAKVIENGTIDGSIIGFTDTSVAKKLWITFQALGDIAFAYPFSVVLLEIQDTVKSPPSENTVMKRASAFAILVTTFFYLGCGCFGYAAFGNKSPGNLLTGFGFYEPFWLIALANICIIIHLIGGYQLFSQPVFAFVERWLTENFPNNRFLTTFYNIKLPMFPIFRVNLFRLCFRTAYVATSTGIALVFPYFNQILGVIGALNMWPLAIYFPVEMYIVQKNVKSWSRKWVFLKIYSGVLMMVSAVALVGSVAGLIDAKMK